MCWVFVSVILSVIYSKAENKMSGTIIIVLTLFTSIVCAGPFSGGAINPAVGTVQTIFQHIIVKNYPNSFVDRVGGDDVSSGFRSIWIYLCGPTFGGFLAGCWKHYDTYIKVKIDQVEAAPTYELKKLRRDSIRRESIQGLGGVGSDNGDDMDSNRNLNAK